MIKINRITPQTVALYSPSGTFMGDINESEFNDIRIQIMTEKANGYYIVFDDINYTIDPIQGTFEGGVWPNGLFDGEMQQFAQIFKLKRANMELKKLVPDQES